MINAKIVADSINAVTGDRLTTFVLPRFPKVLLQELNTHRVFSRNAASSRAIPVKKLIERVRQDPYIPLFTKTKKGMSGIEDDDQEFQSTCKQRWIIALYDAIETALALHRLGAHKQNANRVLEPFARVPVIISGTEWSNFFELRCDVAAYPDFRAVATEMRDLYSQSTPENLELGEWHMPMFDSGMAELAPSLQRVVSTARCARVSFANHDGSASSLDNDSRLHDQLLSSRHLSPFEHSALTVNHGCDCRNFNGFYSYRAQIEEGRLAL